MAKTPHVLILAGWYPSHFHPYSGDFILYQANLLKKAGLSLSILHLDLDHRFICKSPVHWLDKTSSYIGSSGIDHYTKKGFFLPKVNSFIIKYWAKEFLSLYEKFREHWPTPHIIHAHNYMGGLGAYYIKQKYGVSYLITEHSTAFLENNIPLHHTSAINLAFNGASKIIAVSSALQKKIEQKTKTNVICMPNFIDVDMFKPGTKQPNIFTFIFVGDLIPRKNLLLLMDAFQKVQEKFTGQVKLKIAGSGKLLSEAMDKAKKQNLDGSIQFLGQRSQDQLVADLQESHVLILPSQYETFGLVLIEAMACGLPVISTPSGGPESIINESNGLITASFSPLELSKAMEKIYLNIDNYTSDKIRQSVLNRYSVNAVFTQLKEVYSQIVTYR